MKILDITEINLSEAFLHYTAASNLDSIAEKGLRPAIGKNSRGIELSEKIFFTVGGKNMLILMDAWLKWLVLRPKSDFIYRSGVFFMTQKWFPASVIEALFALWIKNPRRSQRACKKLKAILENSVFLALDLEEGVDFDHHDIDEVKSQEFSRGQLKFIYSYGYDLGSLTMEPWNMHTYSGKTVNRSKVSLLALGDQLSAHAILHHLAENHRDYIKSHCRFLQTYLETNTVR
ncbi:hypothetical protein FWG86_01080 [Candidatus Saccharibacteria bacterium]|nr:hypothetical protein [Candidatus Saccharibacteria bacterium]